jgi:uncharacterized membrane protein
MDESSTSQPPHNTSSSKEPKEALKQSEQSTANDQTVDQINAAGYVKVRLGILLIVGILCVILAIVGGYLAIITPEHANDFWVIIGPIITAGMTSPIYLIAGEKSGSGK